jgi:uncharacterized membrane protein YcgQ (UPF0703/DUF1980 family)
MDSFLEVPLFLLLAFTAMIIVHYAALTLTFALVFMLAAIIKSYYFVYTTFFVVLWIYLWRIAEERYGH